MTKRVNELYSIYKISTDVLIENNLVVNDPNYELVEKVNISSNQIFYKILDFYSSTEKHLITDSIINVVVPIGECKGTKKSEKQRKQDYANIASFGFTFNGRVFKRLCSGSGQIRNNTVTFVYEELYDYLFEALCCGLVPNDFGDDFNTAKMNAYFGLNMSGVNFLQKAPRVCVIDDYEEVLPHQEVDYIITKTDKPIINGRKTTVIEKHIKRCFYDEDKYRYDENNELIKDVKSNPINSFDGQGLMCPEYARKVALELGYLEITDDKETGYVPSEVIIRAPWCKGLLVNFDWKEYCKRNGTTKLTDTFGTVHSIDDVEVLISKSQFKMWKIYAKKGGWKYYTDSLEKYNLRWGVVLPNKQFDDRYKCVNYQYINALVGLSDKDIDALCQRSVDKLTRLCSGDIEEVFNTLISIDNGDPEICEGEDLEEVPAPFQSLLEKVIKTNQELLKDTYIQKLIFDECQAKFKNAKIGKVLCRGNYQYMVSDPVGQIQHIIRAHAVDGNKDIVVTGLVPPFSVYSDYWNRQKEQPTEIILMRSPLIDQSEVGVRKIFLTGAAGYDEAAYWYKNIKSGIILPIHDLTALQMQGADYDGDRVFSSVESTLINGAVKNPAPLLYPAALTQVSGAVNEANLIEADIRGLNSKVGKYSNKSTSFYAKLARYDADSPEHTSLLKYIKILGEIVGSEIDSVKSGVKPELPSEWKVKVVPEKYDDELEISVDDCTRAEKDEIFKHNVLVSNIRPHYMRYNYNHIDRNATSTKKALDIESYYNYGITIDKLIQLESMDEEQKKTATKFLSWNPVLDSDCVMNKVCHKFEALEKELKERKGSSNILKQYIGEFSFDVTIGDRVKILHSIYKKYAKDKQKSNKSKDKNHNKVIAAQTKSDNEKMLSHIRRELIKACGDNAHSIYSYCMKYSDANFTWKVLDDLLLQVISTDNIAIKPSEYFVNDLNIQIDESAFMEDSKTELQRAWPICKLPINIYREELDSIVKLNDTSLEEVAFAYLVYSKMYSYRWLFKCSDEMIFKDLAKNKSNGIRIKQRLLELSNNGILKFSAHREKRRNQDIPVSAKFRVLIKRDEGELAFQIHNIDNTVMYYRGYKGLASVCLYCGSSIIKTGNKTKYCADCAKQAKANQNKKYREENRKNMH